MSELQSWLAAHGLGQIADTLSGQDIGLDDLPGLNDDDIRELGLSIGLRRRLINAIAATWPKHDTADAGSSRLVVNGPNASPQEAERRQLTIVFIDVAGSAELSTQLDPEELSSILGAYQACCSTSIMRFGGRIARFFGDGILAYFGYPHAHEDDAERSVLAALAIVRDVPRLRPLRGIELKVRVGIATGLVMVGDLIGKGEAEELAVVGETPIIAARLQAEAPPNGILISNSTHRLTAGLFDCTDAGPRSLKGFSEPVAVWQVLGESAAESRFEAQRARAMAPMIGRTGQLDLLRDRWRQAMGGEGQVALISGEPGLGKSRLIRALREALAPDRPFILAYYCSPHHQTSALYPVITQLERSAGIVHDDAGEVKLAKLEQILVQNHADLNATAPLLAAMLSIPVDDRYPKEALSAEQLKERTLLLLTERLRQLSARQPVLCVFEDLHWIDPSSLGLLERITTLIHTLPVLLVVTTRTPNDVMPRLARGPATHISLSRLASHEAEQLILHSAATGKLPLDIVREIVTRADGVPLFLEELTKTVYEAGLLISNDEQRPPYGALPVAAVPATLHDSLMARLDRMSSIKAVAQMAAVLGRVFSLDLLRAVAPQRLRPIEPAIAALITAEIIYPIDQHPNETYQFKHALLQDVAYQSLLKTTRQRYHERTARTLDSVFPKIAESQPEFVAHHFTEAGLADLAILYWLRAGKRATQRSSNAEAVAHFFRGLALLPGIAGDLERSAQEYNLRLALLTPLMATKGYTSREVEETFKRAIELAEEIDDTEEIFPALNGRQAFEFVTGQINLALVHAEEAIQLAKRNPTSHTGAFAGRFLGTIKLFSGDTVEARPLLQHILSIYDVERHHTSAVFFGQDHFVASASYLSLTMWHLGYLEQARDYRRQAIEHARSLDHMNTLGLALTFAGGCFGGQSHDLESLEQSAPELIELGRVHSLPVWAAVAIAINGKRLIVLGCVEDGIAELRRGIATLAANHIALLRPMLIAWLADAYRDRGMVEEGLAALAEGWRAAEGGERWMDSELHRLEGELLLLDGRPAVTAEEHFIKALEVARVQAARTLELRAGISLARLWLREGRPDAARELLTPIADWFTEGRDTADIRGAEDVLREIGGVRREVSEWASQSR